MKTEHGTGRLKKLPALSVPVLLLLLFCSLLSGCTAIDGVNYMSDATKDAADFIGSLLGVEEAQEEMAAEAPVDAPKEEDPWAKFEVGSGSVGRYSYYESDIETIDEEEEEEEAEEEE
ncbi:MAG: hypothetical protein J6O71_03235, partial [Lachnospiraceae bacterium]|nr:hypothetical protein [Lachnospiraceae bacterium]